MKNFKKLAALTLSAAMATSMLAGCGGSTEKQGSDNPDEFVELTMYLIGDRTADFDEVYGKINEILKEKLNCSLDVEFLGWGEC